MRTILSGSNRRNVLQNITQLTAQINEELSDQASPNKKHGVMIAIGCGGASKLRHQQKLVANHAQIVMVIPGQHIACRIEKFVGKLIHGRTPLP
jgi:hypothetical protein